MKYNKSKTYLFPLLAEVINVNYKFLPFIENTYLQDDENKHKDCFYIMHDFNFKNPEFTSYEHKFTDSELFEQLYDIDNKVLYVFKFPIDFKHEYNCFKNSKYSEFGEDAKKIILEFWTKIYGTNIEGIAFITRIKQILYKEEIFRKIREKQLGVPIGEDVELGNFVYIEEETYKFKNEDVDDN
jgi:hypothetical protein